DLCDPKSIELLRKIVKPNGVTMDTVVVTPFRNTINQCHHRQRGKDYFQLAYKSAASGHSTIRYRRSNDAEHILSEQHSHEYQLRDKEYEKSVKHKSNQGWRCSTSSDEGNAGKGGDGD